MGIWVICKLKISLEIYPFILFKYIRDVSILREGYINNVSLECRIVVHLN